MFPEHDTNFGIGPQSARYEEESQIAKTTITPSHTEISINLPDGHTDFINSQGSLSGSIEACGITTYEQRCETSNDSTAIASSQVDLSLNMPIVDAHDVKTNSKIRVRSKAVKSSGRFLVKCRTDKCREMFESYGARMFHVENYHLFGIILLFNCYLCDKKFKLKRTLRKHMEMAHVSNQGFRCPITNCSKVYARIGNLENHTINVHMMEVQYKHGFCCFNSNYKEKFRTHLSNSHGQIYNRDARKIGF